MMALIGMIIRVVAVATMAPMAVRVAVADDSTTPPAAALVLQQQGLGVTVNFEGRMVLGEPIVGIATIRNNGNESITVQHLDLAGSGVLAPIYKSCSMSFDDQTLQVEESVMGTCTLASNGLRPTAYLYRRHTYRLMAEAKIASRDDPLPMLVEAKLEMPELSVVYGALVGVVLLVVFTSSFRYLKAMPKPPEDLNALKMRAATYLLRLPIRLVLGLVEIAIRAIQGGVIAIILIVLTRSTTDVNAPIAVRVDDFWGGLLVGIFSVPLAAWLAQKLDLNAPSVKVESADAIRSSPAA